MTGLVDKMLVPSTGKVEKVFHLVFKLLFITGVPPER